jgi:hypothetical protein
MRVRYETCDIPAAMLIEEWRKAREHNNPAEAGGD